MSGSRRRARGSRLALRMKLVLAAYVAAAALLPLGHHDLACHLKSSTHCTTCIVGSSAELTADPSALVRQPLLDAGPASATADSAPVSVVLCASSGRSPPVAA